MIKQIMTKYIEVLNSLPEPETSRDAVRMLTADFLDSLTPPEALAFSEALTAPEGLPSPEELGLTRPAGFPEGW